jgi:glutathione synthase/RimK-type ligase-like ATP-grasp enzyme
MEDARRTMTDSPTVPAVAAVAPLPASTRARYYLELARARALQVAAVAGIPRRRTVYVWERVAEHRSWWETAASAIGADFVPLSPRIWEVRRRDRSTRIANELVQLDDPVILEIAGDKELCYRIARDVGVRVPDYFAFDREDLASARARLASQPRPYVVKPASGTSAGIGVTIGIRTDAELVRAVAFAAVRSRRIILQPLVLGESCRLLYLDGELIHAVRRRGVRVRPDGRSSIEILLRSAGLPSVASARTTSAFLAAVGLDLASVLPAGPDFLVSGLPAEETRSEGLRTVYDEDITASVGPELAAECGRIVAAIGSAWAGVDILMDDPGRSLKDSGAFIEVNTTPGILHHCAGRHDACPVAVRVLERLLRDAR